MSKNNISCISIGLYFIVLNSGTIKLLNVFSHVLCARRARLCVWIALTNILFFVVDLLYGISHGLDTTLDLLLMVWNFKDILRFVFLQIYIGNTHCLKNYTLHIMWP